MNPTTQFVWFMFAAILAILAVLLGLMIWGSNQSPLQARKRFDEALESDDEDWLSQRNIVKNNSLTERIRRRLERIPGMDMAEVEMLIHRLDWTDPVRRNWAYASMWLAPVMCMLLGALIATIKQQHLLQWSLAGLIVGFLLSRKGLRWAAERRQRMIRDEMPSVLNLMRLLFDAGLSLEQTLKTISEQSIKVTPILAGEFAKTLERIHHGQDRGEALDELSRRLDVNELSETIAILRQAARYGGNLRESLLRYMHMMEDRRLSDLKETVSKLSAKMTLVMVVFMFPALMIFLAGPGMLSVLGALKQMSH